MAVETFESRVNQARQRASDGDLPGALTAIDSALAAARQAQLFRARLLQALDRPRDALDEVRRLDRPDASAKFLEFRADLEEYLYQIDDAVETLGRCFAVQSPTVPLLARRALLLRATGDFGGALRDLDRAIRMQPLDSELYRLQSEMMKVRKGDGFTKRLDQVAARLPAGSPAATQLEFARAKALEDLGDLEGSFAALRRGNRGMRAQFPYDISTRLERLGSVKSAFGDLDVPRLARRAESAFAPIFVTGLPRSGTTLVEQILTAHPDVSGGGEAAFLVKTFDEIFRAPDAASLTPQDVTGDRLAQFAARYEARMLGRFGPAKRHTDKSLQTLLYAGPVLAAMPKAHIVLVRRDPRAVALSLYKQVFRRGRQLFSYDLDDIRTYQASYDDLIEFWTARLPDRFHVVDYEDVVTAPEPTIRRLLKQVGLSWTYACLRPEENAQPVQTISAVAVRQPINRDALERWRPYAAMMGYDAA